MTGAYVYLWTNSLYCWTLSSELYKKLFFFLKFCIENLSWRTGWHFITPKINGEQSVNLVGEEWKEVSNEKRKFAKEKNH